jgi:hypothetical protein
MSTQFRSRVKSVVDFGTDLKNVGTCCFSDGSSKNLTFYECFIQSGTFIPGENIACPDQGELGTCYACGYLTLPQRELVISTNGSILLENPSWGSKETTRCECTRIGGQLNGTQDPNYPNRDVRIPKACCYFDYNANGFPIGITCENVCSEKECSLKGITYAMLGACCNTTDQTCVYTSSSQCDELLGNVFYPNKECEPGICSSPPQPELRHTPIFTPDKLCSEVQCSAQTLNFNDFAVMALGQNAVLNFDIGPCYELVKLESGYTYDCDLKMLHQCQGYWVNPQNFDSIVLCDNSFIPQVPQKSDGRIIEPEFMKESDFDALGLALGDEYKGGYYIGKYEVDGTVYGSTNLTNPSERYYEDNFIRDSYKKWALIVDYMDYVFSISDKEELLFSAPQTSNSDGFYNCYGNKINFYGTDTTSINTIANTIKNGFADFYIPSINELYFVALVLKNNSSLGQKLNMVNILTSSSIFFEDITSSKTNLFNFNGSVFTYGQNLNTNVSNFGKTVLVPSYQKSYIRLVRKIILTS